MIERTHWENIEVGDVNAYSQVFIFYYKKLYNYGKKFTQDTSIIEDAIEDVFSIIWKDRQKLSGISSHTSYLFSSFRNNLFKKLKLQRKTHFYSVYEGEEIEFSVESIIISRETDSTLKIRIEKAISDLTTRQREAIFLRFYEGLSYQEIAVIMSISVKGTYKLLARALIELKVALGIHIIALLSFFAKLAL
jgi:RNA polymerase sigma factor (sigma-70 family)